MGNDNAAQQKTPDQLGRELVYAAYNGNEARCRELLAQGADVDYYEENMHLTPLMAASKAGNAECIMFLIHSNADKTKKDIVGETAHDIFAQRFNNIPLLGLLKSGAEKHPTPFETSYKNERLLDAARAGDIKRCRELIEEGAAVNHQEDRSKKTALMIACEKGNDPLIAFLIDQGADRGLRDVEYNTAMSYLIKEQRGSPETLNLLLKDFEDHHSMSDLRSLDRIDWGYNRHQIKYNFVRDCTVKLDLAEKYRQNPHEIEFQLQRKHGLNLRKIFNFESYERITVSLDEKGAQNGLCIQPFAHVQNDPDLETAFNLSVKYGGTPDEEKVFDKPRGPKKGLGLTIV